MTAGERDVLTNVLEQLKDLTRKVERLDKNLRLVRAGAEVVRQCQVEMQQHMALIEQRCAERMKEGSCAPVSALMNGPSSEPQDG